MNEDIISKIDSFQQNKKAKMIEFQRVTLFLHTFVH